MKTIRRIVLWLLFVIVLCAALIGGVFFYMYQQTSMQAEFPLLTL